MDISELVKNFKDEPLSRFKEHLNKLVRENYHYSNLDEANKRILIKIIEKYTEKIRNGIGLQYDRIEHEMYVLNKERIKLKLTEEDMKDIKEILHLFKK